MGALLNRIHIAIGSIRKPKLGAVEEALKNVGSLLSPGAVFEILGYQVASGVSHTPATRAELMQGARQRAESLGELGRARGEHWHYLVGLEGGLDVLYENGRRRVLLESWAYVTDGVRGHYGRSGGIELPGALAAEVLEKGIELSVAIDQFAGAAGIRDAQGAWGVLSSNLISRQEAFRIAVVAAFAPFYNGGMYGAAAAAAG